MNERKKKKKHKKKKAKFGLAWGNSQFYGAVPADSSGGLSEQLLKEYITFLLADL